MWSCKTLIYRPTDPLYKDGKGTQKKRKGSWYVYRREVIMLDLVLAFVLFIFMLVFVLLPFLGEQRFIYKGGSGFSISCEHLLYR